MLHFLRLPHKHTRNNFSIRTIKGHKWSQQKQNGQSRINNSVGLYAFLVNLFRSINLCLVNVDHSTLDGLVELHSNRIAKSNFIDECRIWIERNRNEKKSVLKFTHTQTSILMNNTDWHCTIYTHNSHLTAGTKLIVTVLNFMETERAPLITPWPISKSNIEEYFNLAQLNPSKYVFQWTYRNLERVSIHFWLIKRSNTALSETIDCE